MKKKLEEDELKKLLEEEYPREADIMEEALFSEEDGDDFQMPAEEVHFSYNKLVERLKAEEVYREDEEEKKIIPMPAAEKKSKRFNTHRMAKAACLAITCALGVFAASMTSQGNRQHFVEIVDYLLGNDTRIDVVNETAEAPEGQDEFRAMDEIENVLGVDIPDLIYRPEGFEFSDYIIDEVVSYALVKYKCKNHIIVLYVQNKDKNNQISNFSLDGKKISRVYLKDENLQVDIMKIRDKQDEASSCVAQWERENVFYQLSGKMEMEEFEKIIKNMKF